MKVGVPPIEVQSSFVTTNGVMLFAYSPPIANASGELSLPSFTRLFIGTCINDAPGNSPEVLLEILAEWWLFFYGVYKYRHTHKRDGGCIFAKEILRHESLKSPVF